MFILLLWHVCSSQRENVTLDEISCKLSTCNNTLEKLVVTLHGQFNNWKTNRINVTKFSIFGPVKVITLVYMDGSMDSCQLCKLSC